MILHGDALEVLKTLADNSQDSIVTDPPYGLSFMGKHWDYDVPTTELWAECLRVLKPGGYLLSFAGTRTQHRMAVRIEDAGFEIRDMIAWVYGSGFPKSLNIGKAVDKLQGNEREITEGGRIASTLGSNTMDGGQANPNYNYTKGTSPYEGWGTALKPALEPITVARKPISEKNIAQNVLKWGTGGVNIDSSRVEYTGNTDPRTFNGSWKTDKAGQNVYGSGFGGTRQTVSTNGRFPANFIHDGSDEVLGLLGEQARFFYCAKAGKAERNKGLEGFATRNVNDGRTTSGDTQRSNVHPTVKPIRLMQYLVKLVTPAGGTVLDPFNGSGTTGIACKLEGFEYVGIERELEYVEVSNARIAAWEYDKQVSLL